MRSSRITVLVGALALIGSLAAFQLAGLTTARGASSPTADADEKSDGGPAAQAIERAAAVARDSEVGVWRSPVLKDSLLTLLATGRSQVVNALSSKGEDTNRLLDSAAWTLDVALRRVDGEAGESEDAHVDDWITDAETKATLHGHLVQARSEVFRSKK